MLRRLEKAKRTCINALVLKQEKWGFTGSAVIEIRTTALSTRSIAFYCLSRNLQRQ